MVNESRINGLLNLHGLGDLFKIYKNDRIKDYDVNYIQLKFTRDIGKMASRLKLTLTQWESHHLTENHSHIVVCSSVFLGSRNQHC